MLQRAVFVICEGMFRRWIYWWCLRTECWREQFDLRESKKRIKKTAHCIWEFHSLYFLPNRIRVIKVRRVKYGGTNYTSGENRILISKPEAKVSLWGTVVILECINPYPTAFPYGNGMVLHFYQQQESSTTKTVHKVINKGLKTYV